MVVREKRSHQISLGGKIKKGQKEGGKVDREGGRKGGEEGRKGEGGKVEREGRKGGKGCVLLTS